MKSHPLILKPHLAAAAHRGEKWMTRRVVAPHNSKSGGAIKFGFHLIDWNRAWADSNYLHVPFAHPQDGWEKNPANDCQGRVFSRYEVGDEVWIKEQWMPFAKQEWDPVEQEHFESYHVQYRDGSTRTPDTNEFIAWERNQLQKRGPQLLTWQSPRYMPRWACRTVREIKSVRVERVQEISRADAAAEGICYLAREGWKDMHKRLQIVQNHHWPEENFARLWDSINSHRPGCSWADNPWVWVIEWEGKDERYDRTRIAGT